MYEKLKKDIDNIVWWIPFKKLRNSVRNFLNSLFDLNLSIMESKLYNDKFISTKPIMTDKERKLFIDTIVDSKYYLEFGAGGSTFLALKTTNAKVFSVEADSNWINYMRKNYFIYEQELLFRLVFYYIYIGEIKSISYPVDDSKQNNYPNYSSQIFKYLGDDIINKIDIVFIDGRFRVACALNSIINVNKNTKIIIHDFFDRDYYHILLNYLDIIEKSDSLGVFKIKDNMDYDEVKELVKLYCYDKR